MRRIEPPKPSPAPLSATREAGANEAILYNRQNTKHLHTSHPQQVLSKILFYLVAQKKLRIFAENLLHPKTMKNNLKISPLDEFLLHKWEDEQARRFIIQNANRQAQRNQAAHATSPKPDLWASPFALGGHLFQDKGQMTRGKMPATLFFPFYNQQQNTYIPYAPFADRQYAAEYSKKEEEREARFSELADFMMLIENPDSVGYYPSDNSWGTPTGKGYDHNQVGGGVDRNTNVHLTAEERNPSYRISANREKNIRVQTIKEQDRSYKNRINETGSDIQLSDAKEKMLRQMIYKSPSKTAKWWSDKSIQKKFIEGSDEEALELTLEMHKNFFPKIHNERDKNLKKALRLGTKK